MPARTLLVIDDDEVDRKSIARALSSLRPDYELQEASEGRAGLALAQARTFDCILVDYHLPDINGLDLVVELCESLNVQAPIVMLTGVGNEFVAVEAMKRGAYDYLPKTQMGPDALFRVISNAIEKHTLQRQIAEAQTKLERLALYDPLTGLGNRNLFNLELVRAIGISKRRRNFFVLAIMDLDEFKAANDRFGHEAGDAILAAVGQRLRGIARASDAYFRLGGDEFAAILDAGSDGKAVAARIIGAIMAPIPFGDRDLTVSVSIGLAIFSDDNMTAPDLIRTADAAMYRAKKSGCGLVVEGSGVVVDERDVPERVSA
jgi:diguanylate cyclase (GGDEF)-like protein